jgi:enamine deaminase RidA (YjgF/YER057c/UK114 family)
MADPTLQRFGRIGDIPISLAVRAGDFVFTSAVADGGFDPADLTYDDHGNILSDGTDRTGRTFEEETRGTLDHRVSRLAEAGCRPEDVIDVSVWLSDPRLFTEINEIYREYFGEILPTRSVFIIGFVLDARVEVKAVAYRPQ